MRTRFDSARLARDYRYYHIWFGVTLFVMENRGVWIGFETPFQVVGVRMGFACMTRDHRICTKSYLNTIPAYFNLTTAQRVKDMDRERRLPPEYSMEKHYKKPTPGARYATIHQQTTPKVLRQR